METIAELERAWRKAHATWQADPFNPEAERTVNRAADALRRAREANYEAEGVPNAAEHFYKDEH